MEYKPVHLVMVTAGANNNKYYDMEPRESCFIVKFGRIGTSGFQTATYPLSQWNKKYNEKINKGYVDKTDLVADLFIKNIPGKKKYKDIENKAIAEIVENLQQMAQKAVADNYLISSNKVTQAMIDEAQSILNELTKLAFAEADLTKFNELLVKLFTVIPRKMKVVKTYLAKDINDFGKVIKAEQDLLDVMRGQVVQQSVMDGTSGVPDENNITILEAMGLSFEEASHKDIASITHLLGSCYNQFRNAWRVSNENTQSKFTKFVQNEAGDDFPTKLLWHGSRNENWWSIINSGLVLKPTNAVITGKMFGYGTYFATNAKKSLGYTSLAGSYWAKGSSNNAYMGLYEVAYGVPYDVYSFTPEYRNLNYDALQKLHYGAHCLHAHKGSMLLNDEIIVYREDQTTVKYLVEISK